MKLASVGPWVASLGITRKKSGRDPSVRLVSVAEGETIAMSTFLRIGPAALTFWLAAGPIVATTDWLEANCWATVAATAPLS